MWQFIVNLLIGQLPGVVRELAQARVDLSKTQNERERIATEERIKTLEIRKEALESMNERYFILILMVLIPFVAYEAWLLMWDKIACKWFFEQSFCTTDPLSPWLEGTFASLIALLTLKKA